MVYSDEQLARLEGVVNALYGEGFFKKFAELVSLMIRAFDELMRSVRTAMGYIAEVTVQCVPLESVDSLSLEEVCRELEKASHKALDSNLSPRQYGERLSWGPCGRPYKSKSYNHVAVFKRNMPYHRRPQ